jgi:hypothetical protein
MELEKEFPCLIREAGAEIFKGGRLKTEIVRRVLAKERKRVHLSPSTLKKELYLHLYEKKREGYELLGVRRSRAGLSEELGIEERWLYQLLKEKKDGKKKA